MIVISALNNKEHYEGRKEHAENCFRQITFLQGTTIFYFQSLDKATLDSSPTKTFFLLSEFTIIITYS